MLEAPLATPLIVTLYLFNQDTSCGLKGVCNRDVPLIYIISGLISFKFPMPSGKWRMHGMGVSLIGGNDSIITRVVMTSWLASMAMPIVGVG